MAKLTVDEAIEGIKEWSVLEIVEFNNKFEEEFGVTAAAPVAVTAAPGAVAEAEPEEEQDEFDVLLSAVGDQKIQVIKEVRALTSLGLKDAKELVDNAPGPVLEGVDKDAAEKAKEQLEGAGATIELR